MKNCFEPIEKKYFKYRLRLNNICILIFLNHIESAKNFIP